MDDAVTAAADSNPPGELYCTSCEKTFHVGERCPTDGTRLLKLKTRIDPLLGRDLDGRYTILEKLGQGGMGAVYRAQQHSVDREVAIKVVNAQLVSEPDVIKRFLREAKLASKLSHPNAVGVLEFGQTDDGVFYLVMELVTGRTLDDVIKNERTFRAERLVRIGTQICDALEGAHALSIIHRDLKPANIMLLSSGRDHIKVLDFGLAKSVSPDQTSTTMTNAGSVVGTPAFMPPELATGAPCDGRSDLYSLGVILYLMGSGHLPFVSDSVHELLAMHGCDDPAPPMTGVHPALGSVIDRLLRKNPSERYQTAGAAREALEYAMTPGATVDDTHPSLGPFPATASQFKHLANQTTMPPEVAPGMPAGRAGANRVRTPTELQQLISSDTLLPGDQARAVPAGTSAVQPSPAPIRRTLLPLVAVGGALLAAVAMFLALRGGTTETKPTPPAPPIAEPAAKPLPAPPPAPPVEDVKPAVVTPPVTPPTPPPADLTVVKKPPRLKPKHPNAAKPPSTTAKPPVASQNPPTPPKPPPANTGSATKPPALPF